MFLLAETSSGSSSNNYTRIDTAAQERSQRHIAHQPDTTRFEERSGVLNGGRFIIIAGRSNGMSQ